MPSNQPFGGNMIKFNWEHIHLRSPDPEATAEWYKDKLGAEVVKSPQADGSMRIDLNLAGQKIFIAKAMPGKAADAPASPYLGPGSFRPDGAGHQGSGRRAEGQGRERSRWT